MSHSPLAITSLLGKTSKIEKQPFLRLTQLRGEATALELGPWQSHCLQLSACQFFTSPSVNHGQASFQLRF